MINWGYVYDEFYYGGIRCSNTWISYSGMLTARCLNNFAKGLGAAATEEMRFRYAMHRAFGWPIVEQRANND